MIVLMVMCGAGGGQAGGEEEGALGLRRQDAQGCLQLQGACGQGAVSLHVWLCRPCSMSGPVSLTMLWDSPSTDPGLGHAGGDGLCVRCVSFLVICGVDNEGVGATEERSRVVKMTMFTNTPEHVS
jgi:hypothetical protein